MVGVGYGCTGIGRTKSSPATVSTLLGIRPTDLGNDREHQPNRGAYNNAARCQCPIGLRVIGWHFHRRMNLAGTAQGVGMDILQTHSEPERDPGCLTIVLRLLARCGDGTAARL